MNFFKNPLMGALAVAALAMPVLGTAANDGTLGATSQGDLNISVDKSTTVRISGLDDQSFGTLDFMAADTPLVDNFCVFSSTGAYNITITSTSLNGFEMSSGGNTMPYDVELNGDPVISGTPIGGLTADSTSPDCNNTTNANLGINLAASVFNTAAPGFYNDIVTLSVLPE